MQQKQGLTILLLPFPPCPTCGGVVHGADSATVERGIHWTATLTLRPCGHVHAATDDDVHRVLLPHQGDMIDAMEDADNGRRQYDSWLPKDRPFRTVDVIREARARTGAPPEPMTDPAQFGSDGCTCRPFTTDPPRFLDQPGDSVDRDASWQRGTDCPRHAAEAERDEDAQEGDLAEENSASWSHLVIDRGRDLLIPWDNCDGLVAGSVWIHRSDVPSLIRQLTEAIGSDAATIGGGQTATEAATRPARDAGPTVREAAANDRRWPLEKAGE